MPSRSESSSKRRKIKCDSCGPPGAPMRPVPSRACRFDPQHGLEAVRRSAAEGGEAAQARRRGRRPQARRDRQRLVQITRIMGGESRMTDLRCRGRMGLWECGQSKPRTPNRERAQIRIVHRFPCLPRRREPKSASSQMQRRQAEGWQGCGQSRPRTRNPETAPEGIVHRLSTLAAPPRTKNSRTTRKHKNPERCPGSSSEADELDPAQP